MADIYMHFNYFSRNWPLAHCFEPSATGTTTRREIWITSARSRTDWTGREVPSMNVGDLAIGDRAMSSPVSGRVAPMLSARNLRKKIRRSP